MSNEITVRVERTLRAAVVIDLDGLEGAFSEDVVKKWAAIAADELEQSQWEIPDGEVVISHSAREAIAKEKARRESAAIEAAPRRGR